MRKPNFHKWLFVNQGKGLDRGQERTIFFGHVNQLAAIVDDGPTFVATYQLVQVKKLRKQVIFDK